METRSLPPSRRTDTCLSFASYGACRPCTKKSESLPPRTDEHDDQARGSLPPLAHPRTAGSPPPQLSISLTHNHRAAIQAPRQSARVLNPACEAHASRRNASSAVVPRPSARSTPAALSKCFVTISVDVVCRCGSHAYECSCISVLQVREHRPIEYPIYLVILLIKPTYILRTIIL